MIGRVLVLRSNPRDSSLTRLLSFLGSRHRVVALIWDRQGDLELPSLPGVRVVANRLPAPYFSARTLVSVAALQPWFLVKGLRLRPDVVHAMDLDTGVTGLILARLLGVPFVYQCLDPYALALPPGWPKLLARMVHRIENAVITRSDLFVITDLLRLGQHGGSRPAQVVEVANVPIVEPVDTRTGTDFVVGYIGTLAEHRNLDLLIDTIASMPNVRLRIGGFGPIRDRLAAAAADHPNVEFLDWVPDSEFAAVQGSFDCFVQVEDPDHPAYRWVSPNKLFEAMAFGRPIVVAEGTLSADRVAETGHGLAVGYGDPDALAAALRTLRDNPDIAAQLGEKGRADFERRWRPAIIGDRLLAAYDRLPWTGGA